MSDAKWMSPAYQTFREEAPQHAHAWMQMVQQLSAASALDAKTQSLCYLSVLAALRLNDGIPFHVAQAQQAGASRAEIVSAILTGLPAAGLGVTQTLAVALETVDALSAA
jgi:alkylhydroperoxidase/carboxymuconolactone decarboxylase family protein YurZ